MQHYDDAIKEFQASVKESNEALSESEEDYEASSR
jgi:phage-related tail protein